MTPTTPSPGLKKFAKIFILMNCVPALIAVFFNIDDLSTRGEFLDGLVASFAGIALAMLAASTACLVVSLKRQTNTWA